MKRLTMCILALCMFVASQAFAVQPDEMLKDPAQEARARALSANLRCLVCQNQSIDDSNATVAKDLRVLIREQIVQNKTDDEIIAFLVDRYGAFVLLRPQFNAQTLILWIAPFAALGAGLAYAFWHRRRKPNATAAASTEGLSEAEKAELEAILRD